MIPQILHQLDQARQRTQLPWRRLCSSSVPYASVMRWRRRQRLSQPVCRTPGPKKTQPFNAAEFYPLVRQLKPGPSRTPGTGELHARFAATLSRRQFQALVEQQRQDQRHALKRITWLRPGVAWSCDATEYGQAGQQIIPVQDLASRYRFAPLVLNHLDGHPIAAHLQALFRQHGAPLFLKRDNGSPFNGQPVDEVLARFGVLPLNNPPHFPRYNGAMEKGIRDLKAPWIITGHTRRSSRPTLRWPWNSPPTTSTINRAAASRAAAPAPSSTTTTCACAGPGANAKPFFGCSSKSSGRQSDQCRRTITPPTPPPGGSPWNPGSAARA